MTFNLKSLLIAMGVLGAALALLISAPPSFAVPALVFISVGFTASFTAGLVYGRGNTRAFCIGAIFPAAATFIALTWMLCAWFIRVDLIKSFSTLFIQFDIVAFSFRVWIGTALVMQVLIGFITIGVKMAIEKSPATDSAPWGWTDAPDLDDD